jgi:hypothetical protein
MVGPEAPPSSILFDAQTVNRGKVSAKHFRSVAAIEAHDIVTANRLTDRHRRSSLDDGFCCRCAELTKRLMNGRDQGWKLIGGDLIAPDIGGNNCGRELQLVLIGHFAFPHSRWKDTIPGQL